MGTDRASRAMRRSRRFDEPRWRFHQVRERLGEREQIARLDVGARHRIADGAQAIGQQIHHRRIRYVVVQDCQGDAVTGGPPVPARHQIGRAARDHDHRWRGRQCHAHRSGHPFRGAGGDHQCHGGFVIDLPSFGVDDGNRSDLSSSVTGWPKGHRGVQRQGRNDVSNLDARPPWVGLLSIVHSSGDSLAELRKIRPALTP